MVRTRVCEILNIQYPIIQGTVSVTTAELVAAVSEAGGMGTTFSIVPIEELREQIRKIKRLTDKPFSVNLPLFVGEKHAKDIVQLAIEEKVRVVTSSAGSPALYTKQLKEANITVIHVVASVGHAKGAEAAGADIVVASGIEGGGWQSYDEITTMVLLPQVVDAIKVPVVAAGGIADARGFVAALALGAEGVQMGTRFLATVEDAIDEGWRDDILQAKDNSTEIIGRGKRPLRSFKAGFIKERRQDTKATQPTSPWGTAGQVSGLITEVRSAREIIDQIIQGAESIQGRVNEILASLPRPPR